MPGLMLVIEIPWDPNIAGIGGFLLTWHGLFTAIGILAGVQLGRRIARAGGYDDDDAYALALVAVPSGVVGARLLYVIERWDFYSRNPFDIVVLTEGGISIWGAILGGVGGGLAFALWRRYPIARGLDAGGFGLILGQAIGRIGDLVNGEHLARATNLPWGVIYTDPQSPAFAYSVTVGPHHPATTYELLGDLVILGVMFWLFFGPLRRRPGLTFCFYLGGYAVMRFFLTYLRVDSSEVLGLRVPQLVSLLVLVALIPGAWYFATRPPLADAPGAPPGRIPVRRGTRAERRRRG
ncbi:MAG: prolipoprotein diacylglyceryl transferase [Dehalococcoidia bacterium]|nr:prolipoprotein diacylglyceryl transferase [Dehalococcoidia bacterium]